MRYLFCSLSSIGFLGPSISIAQELQLRGHEVAFVTGPAMLPFLDQAGLKRIPRNMIDGESFAVKHVTDPVDTLLQIKHIEYALSQFRPDVMVGQTLTFGPMIVHQRQQIPLAIIGQAAYLWPTTPPQPCYDAVNYQEIVLKRYQLAWKSYKMCCNLLRVPCSQEPETFLGDLFLMQSIPEFEGNTTSLPDRVHFVGDCSWNTSRPDPELTTWIQETGTPDQPLFYLQPGRIFDTYDFWQDIFHALDELPVRIVVSIGRFEGLRPSNSAQYFVRPHVPQQQVLPATRVAISTGTTTSVLGALTHGVPLLLVPGMDTEQMDLALRCAQAGVARVLPHLELTVQSFQRSMQDMLADEMLPVRSSHMQHAFSTIHGKVLAADLLERLALQQTPINRHELLLETEHCSAKDVQGSTR